VNEHVEGRHPYQTTPSRAGAAGRALLGALVMTLALGVGTVVGPSLVELLELDPHGFPGRLVPAALVGGIALSLVVLLGRYDGRPVLPRLGLDRGRSALRGFVLGVVVTGTSAVVVLGAGSAAGRLSWSPADPVPLIVFLFTNGVVALLLEALPEEVTLRGYTWTALRLRWSASVAAVGTTALFLLVPGATSLVQAGVGLLLGIGPLPVGPVPAGQDAVSYLVLLTVFGFTLVAARTATGSLWTAVATHLTFLTVNRITFEGVRRDAGWSADPTPDAVLLVPLYLLVALGVYLVLGRLRRRRPEHTPDR